MYYFVVNKLNYSASIRELSPISGAGWRGRIRTQSFPLGLATYWLEQGYDGFSGRG